MATANEGGRRHWKVRPIEALQCGELAAAELEDALRSTKVLEPMLSEVGQLARDQSHRRRRDEHLAAVPRGGDASGAVDIVADIPFLSEQGRARVDSDSHADLSVRVEVIRELGSGVEGARGGREREEEGVSLRVHLDAAVSNTRLPDHRAVIGERIRVGLCAELVQQRRRAFDVGEDKGDGAGRKVGPHPGIIRSSRPASKASGSPAALRQRVVRRLGKA